MPSRVSRAQTRGRARQWRAHTHNCGSRARVTALSVAGGRLRGARSSRRAFGWRRQQQTARARVRLQGSSSAAAVGAGA
eukprot:1609976-Prymnesium_polylepis.1